MRHGEAGPAGEGRVTDPGRFADLHRIARERLDALERGYAVRRGQPSPADLADRIGRAVQEAVRLDPAVPNAAPLVVSFTDFPGLVVQAGRWLVEAFPACGCDACAETLHGDQERFAELVEAVVAGRLREALRIPWFGQARCSWAVTTPAGERAGGCVVPRARARVMAGSGPRTFDWDPWPQR